MLFFGLLMLRQLFSHSVLKGAHIVGAGMQTDAVPRVGLPAPFVLVGCVCADGVGIAAAFDVDLEDDRRRLLPVEDAVPFNDLVVDQPACKQTGRCKRQREHCEEDGTARRIRHCLHS